MEFARKQYDAAKGWKGYICVDELCRLCTAYECNTIHINACKCGNGKQPAGFWRAVRLSSAYGVDKPNNMCLRDRTVVR